MNGPERDLRHDVRGSWLAELSRRVVHMRIRWWTSVSAALLSPLLILALSQASPADSGRLAASAGGANRAAIVSSPGPSAISAIVKREGAERTLIEPDGVTGIHAGRFGSSVALSGDGDTALIGAPYEDGGPEQNEGPGSAWVFTRSEGEWSTGPEALAMPAADSAPGACGKETPEEGNDEEGKNEVAHACRYGISVALSQDGDTAVIGAPHARANSGAVFVFTRATPGSKWALAAELVNPNGAAENRFGRSVAVSAAGTTVLVGAPIYGGQAFMFTLSGSTWVQTAELTNPAKSEAGGEGKGLFGPGHESEGEGKGLFGQSVALSAAGQTALIGAPGYPGQKGAVWIFHGLGPGESQTHTRLEVAGATERPGETAEEKTAREDTERAAEREARFGASVALSGEGATAIVGAPGYEGGNGAAWVFAASNSGSWPEQAMLVGVDTGVTEAEDQEELGASVALSYDGNKALAGAPRDEGHDGAAWLFERSTGATWSEPTRLQARSSLEVEVHPQVRFGSSVALSFSAETKLVGGRAAEHRGAAWVFGPKPSVEAVKPDKGPSAGGTTVTVTGEHLAEATAVRFGEVEAGDIKVAPDGKSLTAVSPSGTGKVDVRVETPIGASERNAPADQFTYVTKEIGESKGGGEGGGENGGGSGGAGEPPPKGGVNEAPNGETNKEDKAGVTRVGSAGGLTAKGGVLPFGPFSGGACGASLLSKKAFVRRHGRAVIVLRGTGSGRCSGKLTLRVKVAQARIAGKQVVKLRNIGVASFVIAAGQTRAFTIKLGAAGRLLLQAGHGRLNTSLLIVKSSPAPVQARSASVRLTQLEPSKRVAKRP